jgi:hypothetical protein
MILNLTDIINVKMYFSEMITWILVTMWVILPLLLLIKHYKEYKLYYLPFNFIGYILYGTFLIPTLIYGLVSVITCRVPRWSKTKRLDSNKNDTIIVDTKSPIDHSIKVPISPHKKIFLLSPKANGIKNELKIDIDPEPVEKQIIIEIGVGDLD